MIPDSKPSARYLTPPEKACLREAAGKATPGPWRSVEHSWSDTGIYHAGGRVALIDISDEANEENQAELEGIASANAEYIVAANPQTILVLLDEIEALRVSNATMLVALEKLGRAPGCGCSPVCRCGEGDWTRYELEARMDFANETIDAASQKETP